MGSTYLGLALLSAAALAFELTLTRLFSVTQWYHFAFLAVSVALLGYGASGTALTLAPRWSRKPTAPRNSRLSVLFALTVSGAYLSLNHVPFDAYRIVWEWVQLPYLLIYYLALTVPFFCVGLVTGSLLAAHPGRIPVLYAANLLGAAAGALIPVLTLPLLGEGTVVLLAALGLVAAAIFQVQPPRRPYWLAITSGLLIAGALTLLLALHFPSWLQLRLSPYKGLSQVLRFPDSETVWQGWNPSSRVDRISSSAIRSAPGLSLNYPGRLPRQDGLFVDGDDMTPVITGPIDPEFIDHLPTALAYHLVQDPRVLLLEPRGGLDLAVALGSGAKSVDAVESSSLPRRAAPEAYDHPRLRTEIEDGRSYIRRTDQTYDLIQLSLTDSYRPITSGAYSLGERYDLTTEAFQDYMRRLAPEGYLIIERWLQLPPSEFLRAGATAVEALRQGGIENPAERLVAVRDWQVGLLLVKNGVLTPQEVVQVRAFCEDRGLDLVSLPGMVEADANLVNIFPEPTHYRAFRQLLAAPETLYFEQSHDVRPTTDDRPFFFHFFRWGQTRSVLQQLGKTWQPWGGSGYLVLLVLLATATGVSTVLIAVPLAFARNQEDSPQSPRTRAFIYFCLLGLGFLFVEIPLMQHFILFLGQPTYAFAVVLVAVLLFSGLGSLSARRFSPRQVLPFLVMAVLLYPLGLPLLFQALLGLPLPARILVTVLCLAPLSFLMGMPFPGGLAWLRNRAPGLIPWAWAVNGCASVVASVLAAMLALSAGFSWVLAAAAWPIPVHGSPCVRRSR